MTRRVMKQVLRYFRDFEKYDDVRITDAAGEGEYLFDGGGNKIGVNILFSCKMEPKGKSRQKGADNG